MNRLMDQIQLELLEKNLLNDVKYIILTKLSYDKLVSEFAEEFEKEYQEMERLPSFDDLQDHLGVKIIKDKLPNGEEYQLLAKI